MSTIITLPEELVSLILSNLSPKEDSDTIHALRLSNSRLSRLATPLLYRRVHVRMPTPGNVMKTEDAIRDIELIDNIINNPRRLSYIKELQVSQSHARMAKGDEERKRSRATKQAEGDLDIIIQQAVRRENRADVRVAFHLYRCNDLEILSTKLSYRILGKLVTNVIEQAASAHLQARIHPDTMLQPPGILRSLRDISMSDHAYQTVLEDVRTLLCLPALHRLRIGGVADTKKFYDRNPPPHDGIVRNSNPMQLILHSCMLSGPGLVTLLSTCPNAKELTIEWRSGSWNDQFHNQEACDALRERGRDLEMVHYDSVLLYEHRYQDPVGTFGSFAALNTKRLMVPKEFFDHLLELPAEQRPAAAALLLPKSLQELYILGVEWDEKAEVEAIVGVDVIPGLRKSVCVPWYHYEYEEWFGMVENRSVDYDRLGGFELETIGKDWI